MQIEQALDRIGPEDVGGIGFGKAVWIAHQMDCQPGRFLPSGCLQCGIELTEEADVGLAPVTVEGQIKPRRANQIQWRIQSSSAKHSRDGDAFGTERLDSGNQ